jgi:hypothetical protein
MSKLIELIVIAIPLVLFLRAIFPGQSKKLSLAFADLKRHLDYVVWVMLIVMGFAILYSIVMLILN